MTIRKDHLRKILAGSVMIGLTAYAMAMGQDTTSVMAGRIRSGVVLNTSSESQMTNPFRKPAEVSTVGTVMVTTGIACVVYGIASFVVPAFVTANHNGLENNKTKLGVYTTLTVFSFGIGAVQISRGADLVKFGGKQKRLADAWDRTHEKTPQVAGRGM